MIVSNLTGSVTNSNATLTVVTSDIGESGTLANLADGPRQKKKYDKSIESTNNCHKFNKPVPLGTVFFCLLALASPGLGYGQRLEH